VDIATAEEQDGTETLRYDKVVVRCMKCGGKHDSSTMNVPNFASTHFKIVDGVMQCKSASKQGTPGGIVS
jgi:nitrate reductase cytochrome c-type subunit